MSINREPWHLDKKVPIAFLIALFIQTGGLFYWGGQMESRMSAAEQRDIALTSRLSIYENDRVLINRMDERTQAIQNDIRDLKNSVKDLSPRP